QDVYARRGRSKDVDQPACAEAGMRSAVHARLGRTQALQGTVLPALARAPHTPRRCDVWEGTGSPARITAVCLALAIAAASPPVAADDETHACIVASDEGQRLRDDSHLTAARDQFIRCARDVCPAPIRKDCTQWLDDVEQRVPRVVLEARDAAGGDILH